MFFNEAEASADLSAPEPSLTEVKTHYRKSKTRLTTDKLPEDLPVETIEHKLSDEECTCTECNNKLHSIGTDVRDDLKFTPATAVIVRHVRHTSSDYLVWHIHIICSL